MSRGRLPNWKFWSVGQVMSQFGNEPVEDPDDGAAKIDRLAGEER